MTRMVFEQGKPLPDFQYLPRAGVTVRLDQVTHCDLGSHCVVSIRALYGSVHSEPSR